MKKTLLLTLSLIFIWQINGQESKKTYLGYQIGITQSKIQNDREMDYFIQSDWKTNFTAGISYLHFYNNFIGIEIQLNYKNIGTSYEDIYGDSFNDNGKVNLTTDLKYINIPIAAFISPFKTDYFHVSTGFYLSKLISAKQNGDLNEYNNEFMTFNIEKELTKQTNDLDIGLVVGIGSRIKINDRINLSFDIKYNYSFSDMNKSYTNDNTKYNNNYFSIDSGLDFLIN